MDPTVMYKKYEHKQTTSSGQVEVASRGGLSDRRGGGMISPELEATPGCVRRI